ncbi:MAG: GNAT family N-acetyltransferase [Geminicoccaceae bacterium]
MNGEPVETERLRLRRWSSADRNDLARILSDREVMAFSDRGPLSSSQVDRWLAQNIKEAPTGSALGSWAIELKAQRTVVGYLRLSVTEGRIANNEAEIGLRLAKSHWDQGFATEAARKMVHQAFRDPTVARIIGIVDPGNRRSVRMLVKLGMVRERDVAFEGYDHPDRRFTFSRAAALASGNLRSSERG